MKTARYCHYLALCAYLSLFALLMLWNIVLAPSKIFPIALVLLVMITPLLIPLRGLLKGDKRTCAWTAYISLLYFIHGSQEAYINVNERLWASLEVILSLLLFFGATFYVRLSRKQES